MSESSLIRVFASGAIPQSGDPFGTGPANQRPSSIKTGDVPSRSFCIGKDDGHYFRFTLELRCRCSLTKQDVALTASLLPTMFGGKNFGCGTSILLSDGS
jgi:hypothetical protein